MAIEYHVTTREDGEGVTNSPATHRVSLPEIIAMRALQALKMQLILPRLSRSDYSNEFLDKIGDTVTIKRPYKTKSGSGRFLQDSDFEGFTDETTTISVDQRRHWATSKIDEEDLLDINSDASRYLAEGMVELAIDYDLAGFDEMHNSIAQQSGNADGSSLTTSRLISLSTYLENINVPKHVNMLVVPPEAREGIFEDLIKPLTVNVAAPTGTDTESTGTSQANWYNPSKTAMMIEQNMLPANLGGFQINYSVNLARYKTLASAGTPIVNSSGGYEGDSLPTDGWTASTNVLSKGTIININNVYQVQPRGRRESIGKLMDFVVTEDVTSNASGEANIPISPRLNAGTLSVGGVSYAAYQNVSAVAADNATITIVGGASTAKNYLQGNHFGGGAMQYVNLRLPPSEFDAANGGMAVDPETGLVITHSRQYSLRSASTERRWDVFFGTKNIYPELTSRIILQEI